MNPRRMFPFAPVLLALLLPMAAAEFTVAPDGDDRAPGTREKPFATLSRAREAIREWRAGAAPKEAVQVRLRQGTYFLPETFLLEPRDSGTAQFPVTYASAPGEKAVLSGGRPIEGLQEGKLPGGARVWTAQLPSVKSGAWYFRQLFATPTGAPAYARRYRPHLGMKRVDGLTYSPRRKAASHRAAQIDFMYAPGDFKPWENLADVEVVVLHVWSSSRLLIQGLDPEHHIVTFTGMPTFAVDQGGLQPYYIENVKEALASPGEWYLDRKSGELRYLPLAGESLGNTRLVAPALARVVAVQGDWAKGDPVHHVVFSNLGFSHNETPLPKEGYGGSQGQPDLGAAVELVGADSVALVGCTIAHVGSYGVAIGRGCHGDRVVGCRLADLAGGGVKVGDPALNASSKDPEVPADNRVENCSIVDGGLMYFSANAIWGGIVRGLQLRHNEIENFAYAGIAVGWSWNDTPTACASNLIEANVIRRVCTLLADGASIYTLGRQPGTVIRGNVVMDNPKSIYTKEHWQLGLYLDEGSSEMLVEDNLVARVGTHGFNLNGGAQNLIRNNILGPVYGNHGPFIRSYKKPFTKGNVFERNLIWCDSPNLADAAWAPGEFLCRSNLYWHRQGSNFAWFGKRFEEWQGMGQDEGSLLADPLFKDPANDDYTLKPGSPASRVGFRPFDFSKAGLEAAWKGIRAPASASPAPVFSMKLPTVDSRPPDFSFDFENIPLGVTPRGFGANGFSPEANFQVSEECAYRGKRSLKVTDAKSAAKSFYPYLTFLAAKPLHTGKVALSAAIRLKPEAPIMLDLSFRDYTKVGNATKEFTGGPSVQFQPDGRVTMGGEELAQVPLGKWALLSVEFDFGGRAAKVSVKGDGVAAKEKALELSKEFTAFSWFGFIAGDSADGNAYIDDLKMVYTP
ncbi:MAG: right-handed parallel beta-helix repeat-containing protein [Spirochaetes bacterium]|nr:right-handed parallel beta-helix repeat-containing protein [Spirochaetota bacterium]